VVEKAPQAKLYANSIHIEKHHRVKRHEGVKDKPPNSFHPKTLSFTSLKKKSLFDSMLNFAQNPIKIYIFLSPILNIYIFGNFLQCQACVDGKPFKREKRSSVKP
jgi:hypothetical protein